MPSEEDLLGRQRVVEHLARSVDENAGILAVGELEPIHAVHGAGLGHRVIDRDRERKRLGIAAIEHVAVLGEVASRIGRARIGDGENLEILVVRHALQHVFEVFLHRDVRVGRGHRDAEAEIVGSRHDEGIREHRAIRVGIVVGEKPADERRELSRAHGADLFRDARGIDRNHGIIEEAGHHGIAGPTEEGQLLDAEIPVLLEGPHLGFHRVPARSDGGLLDFKERPADLFPPVAHGHLVGDHGGIDLRNPRAALIYVALEERAARIKLGILDDLVRECRLAHVHGDVARDIDLEELLPDNLRADVAQGRNYVLVAHAVGVHVAVGVEHGLAENAEGVFHGLGRPDGDSVCLDEDATEASRRDLVEGNAELGLRADRLDISGV